ncbi:alginate export family protein [Candidatus Dependentiae bacterium]|nr:alginate export family protein [Candidatus Dependentiae bacterium]
MRKLILFMLVVLIALPAYAGLDLKDLKLNGHYRLRGYYVQNDDSLSTINDLNRFYRQRIWLGTEANVAENVLFNVTLELEKEWGKSNTTPASPTATLVSGYVKFSKLFDKELALTIGRQAYQLNKNNFVVWDSANGLDGMRLNYVASDWEMDVLYLKVAEPGNVSTTTSTYLADTTTGVVTKTDVTTTVSGDLNDVEFYGVVGNYKGFKGHKLQGYVLFDRNGNANNESNLKRYIGIRGEGDIQAVEGLSYIAEYINLGGDNGAVNEIDYKGSLIYLSGAYMFKDMKSLKLVADYLVASGDNDNTNNKEKAFQFSSFSQNAGTVNLEGNFNFDNGMDAYFFQRGTYSNLRALGIGLSFKPADKWFVGTKYSVLKQDKVAAGADKKLGNNFDLCAKYDLGKNYCVTAGYSMFDPKENYVANGEKTEVLAAEFRINF